MEARFEQARSALGLIADPIIMMPSSRDNWDVAVVASEPPDAPSPYSSSPTLGEIYDLYVADPRHAWTKRTVISYQTTRTWLCDVFGANKPIDQITREGCREFMALLIKMPKHADKRFSGMSLRQAVEAAKERADVERIPAKPPVPVAPPVSPTGRVSARRSAARKPKPKE